MILLVSPNTAVWDNGPSFSESYCSSYSFLMRQTLLVIDQSNPNTGRRFNFLCSFWWHFFDRERMEALCFPKPLFPLAVDVTWHSSTIVWYNMYFLRNNLKYRHLERDESSFIREVIEQNKNLPSLFMTPTPTTSSFMLTLDFAPILHQQLFWNYPNSRAKVNFSIAFSLNAHIFLSRQVKSSTFISGFCMLCCSWISPFLG